MAIELFPSKQWQKPKGDYLFWISVDFYPLEVSSHQMFPPKLETFVDNSENENCKHRSDKTTDTVDSPGNIKVKFFIKISNSF
jgi:hypothetical protein